MAEAPLTYNIINCEDPTQQTTVATDLSAYVGMVISIEESPPNLVNCWLVSPGGKESGIEPVVVSCYRSCEECTRTIFKLSDCEGFFTPKYSEQADLEQYVGKVVKIPYYDNSCFLVEVLPYSKEYRYETIGYSNGYDDCKSCKNLKTIVPGYESILCETDYVEKISCSFGELMYQKMVSNKFGVQFCCPLDFNKIYIKKELLEINLIKDPDPQLPEPEVDPCCINTGPNCSAEPDCCTACHKPRYFPYMHHNLDNCVESPPFVHCHCHTNGNKFHDCHLYSFTLTGEMFDEATGNTNLNSNGKIYFGYYPCGEHEVVTEKYIEPGVFELCVLGLPILGYYKNNNWQSVEILFPDTLLRGLVCEEPQITLNCNCYE